MVYPSISISINLSAIVNLNVNATTTDNRIQINLSIYLFAPFIKPPKQPIIIHKAVTPITIYSIMLKSP